MIHLEGHTVQAERKYARSQQTLLFCFYIYCLQKCI